MLPRILVETGTLRLVERFAFDTQSEVFRPEAADLFWELGKCIKEVTGDTQSCNSLLQRMSDQWGSVVDYSGLVQS